mgnify:CR=1 FL=1
MNLIEKLFPARIWTFRVFTKERHKPLPRLAYLVFGVPSALRADRITVEAHTTKQYRA